MDHNGDVVEVNRATERTFGYRAEEMVGRELAELIVPPSLRAAHRRGVAALPGDRGDHDRVSPARARRHARRRQRVPGRGGDHPRRPSRPAAVLRLPARRHRGAGARARAAAAGGGAGGAAARGDGGGGVDRPAARVQRRHRGGRAAARRAELEHGALQPGRHGDGDGRVERRRRSRTSRSATRCAMDGDTASARVYRTGAPARDRELRGPRRSAGRRGCRSSGSSRRWPGRSSSTGACGAR